MRCRRVYRPIQNHIALYHGPNPMTPNNNQSTDWLDYVRAFATCSVVLLHVAAFVLVSSKITLASWWTANVYDSAMRACVPLFLMLTGALVVPQKYELLVYLKKRLIRIILPFLFWNAVYDAYKYYVELPAGAIQGLSGHINWLYATFQKGAMYHFWYIYMCVGIYLFIPVISPWLRNTDKYEIIYFLCIWIFTLFESYPFFNFYAPKIELQYFSGYLGYVVLGYFIATQPSEKQIFKGLAITAVLLGFLLTAFGVYYFSIKNHQLTETAYGNLTPNVLLMAAGIFYLVKQASWPPVSGIVKLICRNNYTIYLAHVLVLLLLQRAGINAFIINPILGIPLVTLLCLGITICLAWGLNKSPFGKYIGG